MSVAYWCVFIAFILPYVFTVTAKAGAENFDNRAPRVMLSHLTGWRQRAHWTQLNSFEAFPPFAASVIIAHLMEVPQTALNQLAIGFIIFRILYGIFYITDKPGLRSLAWFGGFLCVCGLFVSAI